MSGPEPLQELTSSTQKMWDKVGLASISRQIISRLTCWMGLGIWRASPGLGFLYRALTLRHSSLALGCAALT